MSGSATPLRSVVIEADLRIDCDGVEAGRLTSDGDGVVRLDLASESISKLPRGDSPAAIRSIRQMVRHTGQTVELSIDGTPAVRVAPKSLADGQVTTRIKVLKLTKLISLAIRRLRGN